MLSLSHAWGVAIPCGGSQGCEVVARSAASKFAGIPVAYFGLGAYLTLAALAILRFARPALAWVTPAAFLITLSGALISFVFVYISLFQIREVCNWCMASAAIMLSSLIFTSLMATSSKPGTVGSIDWGVTGLSAVAAFGYLGIRSVDLYQQRTEQIVTPEYALAKKIEDFVPAGANFLGKPDAKVIVVEFGDLLCPHCRTSYFHFKDLVEKTQGKLQFVFRHFALTGVPGHELSAPAAIISEYAAEQGKFWPYLEGVFQLEREKVNENSLLGIVSRLGLDPAQAYQRSRTTEDPAFERFYRDREEADKLGIISTPTFLMGIRGQAPELETLNTYKTALSDDKYQSLLK